MIIESGIIVGVALLATLMKAPRSIKNWMLSHPFLVDCVVFAFLIVVHWGTFAGVLAATFGALITSIFMSLYARFAE